jgi:hypothetical protein
VTGAGTLWLAITLLFLVASWRRRARTRALYERWEEDEPELHPGEDPVVRRRDDGGDWSH